MSIHRLPFVKISAFFALVFASQFALADVSGINAAVSHAGIRFDDSNGTPAGGIYPAGSLLPPWTGALLNLGGITDATTLDYAQGQASASFTPLTYALNIPIADLIQAPGNTGSIILDFILTAQFQMDALGFATGPTQMPTFFINGTVQPGGFAFFTGNISYTSAASGLLDNVTYAFQTNTPGTFSVTLPGVPSSGTTPTLPANDTLTLAATFRFVVDPAEIHATTVPEPSATLLLALGALGAGARRWVRTR